MVAGTESFCLSFYDKCARGFYIVEIVAVAVFLKWAYGGLEVYGYGFAICIGVVVVFYCLYMYPVGFVVGIAFGGDLYIVSAVGTAADIFAVVVGEAEKEADAGAELVPVVDF